MILFGWFRRKKKKLTDAEYAAKLKAAREVEHLPFPYHNGSYAPPTMGRGPYRCMGCYSSPERYPLCDKCYQRELAARGNDARAASLRQATTMVIPAGTTVEEPAASSLRTCSPAPGLSFLGDDSPGPPPAEPPSSPFDGGGGSFSGGGATGGWEPLVAPEATADLVERDAMIADAGAPVDSSSDGGTSE